MHGRFSHCLVLPGSPRQYQPSSPRVAASVVAWCRRHRPASPCGAHGAFSRLPSTVQAALEPSQHPPWSPLPFLRSCRMIRQDCRWSNFVSQASWDRRSGRPLASSREAPVAQIVCSSPPRQDAKRLAFKDLALYGMLLSAWLEAACLT